VKIISRSIIFSSQYSSFRLPSETNLIGMVRYSFFQTIFKSHRNIDFKPFLNQLTSNQQAFTEFLVFSIQFPSFFDIISKFEFKSFSFLCQLEISLRASDSPLNNYVRYFFLFLISTIEFKIDWFYSASKQFLRNLCSILVHILLVIPNSFSSIRNFFLNCPSIF
jgi:hypothetical protein